VVQQSEALVIYWTVTFSVAKGQPFRETGITASTSHEAWLAFGALGVGDYHTAQAFQVRALLWKPA
jgi:hypothetical protein